MSFMRDEVTRKMGWIEIDGTCGTTWVPDDVVGQRATELAQNDDRTDEETDELKELVSDYYEGGYKLSNIYTVGYAEGYGARLSAPGYMDCTDWSVFDTAEEAEQHLKEFYHDDEEEDADEDEA